ncbi:cytochrome P450 [Streptomyces sp. SID13031]|uniref:cytochrome P450 n=1 Tax=Streptomyces sp. SID13031 TaxID=2706046 RepID=UPI0013CAD55E|nr:cytochrome P450 [Streptomyces sp. SID13031]NEA30608.1 cytochrome P450 [Streptomyces sp. SID13031]
MTSQKTAELRDKRAAACPRELSIYSLTTGDGAGRARELFGALAERGPVHWDPYVAAWLICGVTEVTAVLADDRFSSYRSAYSHGEAPAAGETDLNAVAARMLLLKDGADHLRLKRVVQAVLSPRRIKALEPWMRELAAELLPAGSGPMDFAGTVARDFPLRVLAKLLGIPAADLPMVLAGSDAMTEIVGGLNPTLDEEVHRKARRLHDYALRMVREARANPRDDGTTDFVAAADAAGGFDDADIAANLVMLIASGHQTLPGFLTLSLQDAFAQPDKALRPVPDALAHVTPSRFVGRVVTERVELGGCLLETGDAVVVLLAAANWSLPPAEPGKPLRHLAFGHGRHRCAGAAMAELEAAVMFDRLAAVCPVTGSGTPTLNTDVNLPALTSQPIELPATTGCPTHPVISSEDIDHGHQ